jgi:hypothetical protein
MNKNSTENKHTYSNDIRVTTHHAVLHVSSQSATAVCNVAELVREYQGPALQTADSVTAQPRELFVSIRSQTSSIKEYICDFMVTC